MRSFAFTSRKKFEEELAAVLSTSFFSCLFEKKTLMVSGFDSLLSYFLSAEFSAKIEIENWWKKIVWMHFDKILGCDVKIESFSKLLLCCSAAMKDFLVKLK